MPPSVMFDSVANGHQTTKPVMDANNRRSIRPNDLETDDSSEDVVWLIRSYYEEGINKRYGFIVQRERSSCLFLSAQWATAEVVVVERT